MAARLAVLAIIVTGIERLLFETCGACPDKRDRELTSRLDISRTFEKGMLVLNAFDGTQKEMSIADVARRIEIDRAIARRLVHTLVHLGYLYKRGDQYRLSPKILLLASGFLQSRHFTKTVVPVLNEFSRNLDAPIYLATRDGFHAVYLAHAALENRAISIGLGVGSRLPVLATGIGRALLLIASEDERYEVMAHAPLERHTTKSVLDRSVIAQKILEAEECGYAFADGEFEAGIAALALPFRKSNPFPLALGISSECERFSKTYLQTALRTLRSCRDHLADTVEQF